MPLRSAFHHQAISQGRRVQTRRYSAGTVGFDGWVTEFGPELGPLCPQLIRLL